MANRWCNERFDYPKADDPQRETKLVKRLRHIKRERMLKFRSVPVARRAWWVTLTAMDVCQEDFAPGELAAALSFAPREFWVLSRRKAKALVGVDVARGGSGRLYPAEYRICPVCSRVLLGAEAAEYRKKQMRPIDKWDFATGPACNLDCKPRGRGVNGMKATYKARRAA